MSTIADEFKRLQEELAGSALHYPGPASVVAALIIADAIGALVAEMRAARQHQEAKAYSAETPATAAPPQRPLPSEPFRKA
jgi:hypothetical protein